MIKFLKQNNMACPQCLKLTRSRYSVSGGRSFCRRGFTLVETLVAISIFSVSFLGIMSVLASSISNTTYIKQKIIASYLAQEGIEYIRNMRDTFIFYDKTSGWNNFKSKLNSCNGAGNECGFNVSHYIPLDSSFIDKCNNSNICKVYLDNGGNYNTNSAGVDSGFTRKIWMMKADGSSGGIGNADEVRIYSEVKWTQGSGLHNITFFENLFNWVE
jgi:prepilin-type N-terminal cleavage/methylation domain-containing protein